MTNTNSLENIVSYVENLIAGICLFQINKNRIQPIYVNEGCCRMLGYNRQEMGMLLKHVELNIIADDLPVVRQGIADILKDDGPVEFAFRTVTLSGGVRWLQVRGNLYSRRGNIFEVICILLDITEKRAMEEEMLEQAERLNLIVESEQEIIIDYNARTDVMMIREIARNGLPKEEIIPKYFERFDITPYHPDDVDGLLGLYHGLLKRPGKGVIEYRHKRFTEEFRWFNLALSSIQDMDGYVTRIVGRMLDIQERKLRELDLTMRAEKDSLTGLYNRGAVTQMITNTITESAEGVIHALLVVDLDNFKNVNDTLGHVAGDQLIISVATRLLETFKGYDIIGRIGGDEFVIFLKDIEAISNADILATKLLKALQTPYELPGGTVEMTSSIGISIYPYHGSQYKELFDKADKAMYCIKGSGKNSYRIYDAAATRVFHASKRIDRCSSYTGSGGCLELEDLILDILYEERDKQSAWETVFELISAHYGWQRAYSYPSAAAFRGGQTNIFYAAPGFEEKDEDRRIHLYRAEVMETFCDFKHKLKIFHEYDKNLSEEQLRYMTENNVHGIMYYPLLQNGEYSGCIAFERLVWKDIEPDQETRNGINSILRILDAYSQNTSILNKVPNVITQIKLIDNLDNYVYVLDYDTRRLSFFNKKVLEKTPDINLGDKCCKILQNSDVPCDNCILKHLDRNNPHDRYTEEFFNYSTRSWMRSSISWLECTDHTAICLMDCMDISEYFVGP